MNNIKLTLEYDGTNYVGWQKQKYEKDKKLRSVQGTLESIISKVLKEDVELIGCSRTDTGVHATEYVANFFTNTTIPPEKIKYALNTKLPDDIVILDSQQVEENFHARYNSTGKTYMYSILNREMKVAIKRNYLYQYRNKLNLDLMRQGAKYFLGTHDFQAFKNKGSSVKTSVRTIKDIRVENDKDNIRIYISADGFLYNMVRIMVGTLIQVGEGRILPEDIRNIIESKNRKKAGKKAPSQGLTLVKVHY